MRDKGKNVNPKRCIHCHKCRENCTFLTKYRLDIGDIGQWEKLLYHCFLCGKCTGVCPQGIDGRQVVLKHALRAGGRKRRVPEGRRIHGSVKRKRWIIYIGIMTTEQGGSVLFAGCSFPLLIFRKRRNGWRPLLKEKAGIGIVFDCCGKPVAELGLREDAGRIIERIDRKLTELHIDEVIMVCPNCYAYLKDRLTARVITIYEKLAELGIGRKISGKTDNLPAMPGPGKMGDPFPYPAVPGRRAGTDNKDPVLAGSGAVQGRRSRIWRDRCLRTSQRGKGSTLTVHLVPGILQEKDMEKPAICCWRSWAAGKSRMYFMR